MLVNGYVHYSKIFLFHFKVEFQSFVRSSRSSVARLFIYCSFIYLLLFNNKCPQKDVSVSVFVVVVFFFYFYPMLLFFPSRVS